MGSKITLILDINFPRLSLNILRYVPGFFSAGIILIQKVNINIDSDLVTDTRLIKSLSCKIGE